MKANKDLLALYQEYLRVPGVMQVDTAGYLVLAHVLLEVKEAILYLQSTCMILESTKPEAIDG